MGAVGEWACGRRLGTAGHTGAFGREGGGGCAFGWASGRLSEGEEGGGRSCWLFLFSFVYSCLDFIFYSFYLVFAYFLFWTLVVYALICIFYLVF